MKLRDVVVEQAILPRLATTARDEVVAELVDALVAGGAIAESRRDEHLRQVVARENRGSTGVGQGVAIPHVKSAAATRISVAIGVSEAGIDFRALDRQPVHIVFLVLSPEARPEEHIDVMHLIVTTLGQQQFRRFLRQATTVSDVVTLLEEADASQPIR